MGNGSLAVVNLKKSLNQQIVDISSVFESRDVTVACRDPQLVQVCKTALSVKYSRISLPVEPKF